MEKCNKETKVKKTLIRNYEQSYKGHNKQVAEHDMQCFSKYSKLNSVKTKNNIETDLTQPTICSSDALASYISDVKLNLPAQKCYELSNADKACLGVKMTRKLNFHFNDRMFKNLIELNTNIDEVKTKKGRRPITGNSKRDLEPNIEDFCQDERDIDVAPSIPIINLKFRPVKKIENCDLHDLMASLEDL